MANKKISAMSALGATPDTLDVLPLVDVSDVSSTSTGETKKITVGNLILDGTQTLTNKTLTDCDASTQTAGNDTTKIATTAFVTNLISVGTVGTGVWQGTAIDGAYVDIEGTEVKSAGPATDGYVLTADGAGGAAWESGSGSGTVTSITPAADTGSGTAITGSGTLTSTGGDGIATSVSTTTTTFALDLKANGGTVIESNELAVDLAASSITGTLAVGDGGTGLTAITTLLNSNVTPASLSLEIGTDVEAYNADIAKIDEADEWTAAQNFNNRSLTFDATQDWNLETDQVCDLTLTANTVFDAPTNMNDGGFYSITIIQDSTGSRTAAWNAVFKWAGGPDNVPTLTTTATTGKDIFVFRSDGTNMYEVGRQLDLK